MIAEALIREGKPHAALAEIEKAVRKAPTDAKLRIFLFQVLSLLGQWDRALTQLNVIADLDAATLLMVTVYREVISAEALRESVFGGKKSPMLLGEPDPWLGWLVESVKMLSDGKTDEAVQLHDAAFNAAPVNTGRIDGKTFAWIADGDGRLGPVLEVIVKGNYYWVPFKNIAEIEIEKPTDLRDLVWAPANFTWANSGKAVGFIPARYPGSAGSSDDAIKMCRRTDWLDESGLSIGLGQRVLATDVSEQPVLEVRKISIDQPGEQRGS